MVHDTFSLFSTEKSFMWIILFICSYETPTKKFKQIELEVPVIDE